jgi:hypothetical protein
MMDGMDDLVQFLRDRFDDDVRVALDASGFTVVEDAGQWVASPAGDEWEAARTDCEEDQLLVALRQGLDRPPEVMNGLWGAIVSDVPELSQQPGSASVLPQLVHAARHDPARVLAEVDAKRRILLLHNIPAVVSPKMAAFGLRDGEAPEDDRRCAGCGLDDMDDPITPDVSECPILRALALPYADHPGYRAEWATQPPDHED